MDFQKTAKIFLSRAMRNVFFWLLLAYLFYPGHGSNYHLFFVVLLINALSLTAPVYITNDLLIPKFFLKRKYLVFSCFILILLLISALFSYYLTIYFNRILPEFAYMQRNKANAPLVNHMFLVAMILIIMAMAKLTSDGIFNQRRLEQLESRQLMSELESLKSQINPHFLFNSLNTIYGLAQRKDQETAEAIVGLSDILRYVLYDCNVSFISLKKEIAFLSSFIEFAKLRNDNTDISFSIDSEILDERIAPLILLPFVENAIKFGQENQLLRSWIQIKILLSKEDFYFECANSNYERDEALRDNGGFGLKNVKRRLDLIYEKKYTLEIDDNNNEFNVRLKLKLK